MKRACVQMLGVVTPAALVAASPAHAQLAPGASGWSSAPTEASEAEYWIMMRRMGLCLADAKREQSVAFMDATPGSAAEDAAVKALFNRSRNRCMGNFVSASMLRSHMRGVVAEGLVELLPDQQRQALARSGGTPPAEVLNFHDFARCYVANHPSVAIDFLSQTKVATDGEREAIRQMASDFGPCLPADREVRINPMNARMAIAEAVFHAARALPAEPAMPIESPAGGQ